MNRYVIIGIIGVFSGLLCALADVPLAYSGEKGDPGSDNVNKIASWWTKVPESHFSTAFWLSFLGQPGTYLTMWMLGELIGMKSPGLGLALKINTAIGCYTGLLFHADACTKPLVYRAVHGKVSEQDAGKAVDAVGKHAQLPSVISAMSLIFGTTVIVTWSIFAGALDVPFFMAFFNPVFATLILFFLKKRGFRIVGPIGMGFVLFALVLMTAGLRL